MNINVKTSQSTFFVSFGECSKLQENHSAELKQELLGKLVRPFTNVILNFNDITEIDNSVIQALMAGQRLSTMNKGQVSLYNVNEQVYMALKKENVAHLFFYCDRAKPFSRELGVA